jgi:hypothetical protein
MFLTRRPSQDDIDRFLDHSRGLPLSYGPPGLVREKPKGNRCTEVGAAIGPGAREVSRARAAGEARFGFAYGTLTNHAESGEELFEVFVDGRSGQVMYRIRAMSWPQTVVTRIGRPIVRLLQARLRRDSIAAMRRASVNS